MSTCTMSVEMPPRTYRLSGMQLSAIKTCSTEDRVSLESKFSKFGVHSIVDRSAVLLKAMGIGENDNVFYSGDSDECNTEQEQYEALVGAFLSGIWKPNTIFLEKKGLNYDG